MDVSGFFFYYTSVFVFSEPSSNLPQTQRILLRDDEAKFSQYVKYFPNKCKKMNEIILIVSNYA